MMLALAVAAPALLVGHGRAPLARSTPVHMAAPESTPRTEMKLTPTLIEWGVDAELWRETRNKQALLELAEAGDEAKARERIAFLRKAVAGGHTKSNDRPYVLKGAVPAGEAQAGAEAQAEAEAQA